MLLAKQEVLVDEETDHMLGVHLVGPHVGEVINIFALAIRHTLLIMQLVRTLLVLLLILLMR